MKIPTNTRCASGSATGRRLNFLLPAVLTFIALVPARARPSTDREDNSRAFRNQLRYLLPTAERTELFGITNPAGLAYLSRPDGVLGLEFAGLDTMRLNSVGFFGGSHKTGVGVHYRLLDDRSWTMDLSLGKAFGTRALTGGIGISARTASRAALKDTPQLSLGALVRPTRHVSMGVSTQIALGDDRFESMFTAGIRPLGNEYLTLGGDWSILRAGGNTSHTWGISLSTEPVRGLRLSAGYGADKRTFIGLSVGLGYTQVGVAGRLTSGSTTVTPTYAIRLGAHEPSALVDRLNRGSSFMELNLHRDIVYQAHPLFDDSPTLLGILKAIEAARIDPTVDGVVVQASMAEHPLTFVWEIREKLRELRAAGKKVVVYVDGGRLKQYYLASVADRIVMDPQGSFMLSGVLSGSTYYRGTLEKLGVGFDEWRFFKYKSAIENLGRDSMSEGAREQREALIADIYSFIRRGVCEERKMSQARFDSLVNEGTHFRAPEAVAAGLVDTIGRWESANKVIERMTGDTKKLEKPCAVVNRMSPDHDHWGPAPRVAIIYALGACAMDRGINARSLVKVVRKAGKDKRVKAIVIRVDSPGGDPMASDIVAEAIRECTEKKPVVISQGSVAASGGYWLSMYGDTIIAAPPTITGSIGVIGGWVYNAGLKEKLGMTTDHVKIGEHADLPFGFSLPGIGTVLPDRNLTPHERMKARETIMAMYEDFVGKVAEARGRDTASIDSVAQGRVWTGGAAMEKGLVDKMGGLYESVKVAAAMAGIDDPSACVISQAPQKEFSLLSLVVPRLASQQAESRQVIDYYYLHTRNNGQPLLLMPIELW